MLSGRRDHGLLADVMPQGYEDGYGACRRWHSLDSPANEHRASREDALAKERSVTAMAR
jgi:hypothetical protein